MTHLNAIELPDRYTDLELISGEIVTPLASVSAYEIAFAGSVTVAETVGAIQALETDSELLKAINYITIDGLEALQDEEIFGLVTPPALADSDSPQLIVNPIASSDVARRFRTIYGRSASADWHFHNKRNSDWPCSPLPRVMPLVFAEMGLGKIQKDLFAHNVGKLLNTYVLMGSAYRQLQAGQDTPALPATIGHRLHIIEHT